MADTSTSLPCHNSPVVPSCLFKPTAGMEGLPLDVIVSVSLGIALVVVVVVYASRNWGAGQVNNDIHTSKTRIRTFSFVLPERLFGTTTVAKNPRSRPNAVACHSACLERMRHCHKRGGG